MWDQPHFWYHADGIGHSSLDALEQFVPGALVYGRIDRKRIRLEKLDSASRAQASIEIYVPLHGAWLVEGELSKRGISYRAIPCNVNGVTPWNDSRRDELEAYGRAVIDQLVEKKFLREHVSDIVTPYQATASAWSSSRPYAFFVHACGAGKTLSAIISALIRGGRTLVLCPAKARHVWWSQIQEYTHLEPYRVRPAGERKAGDESLTDYLERVGRNAFVVVGAESIHEYMSECYETQPTTLILDELHTHGSSKRWQAVHNEDGTVDFEHKTTKANKVTRAVCIMQISRLPTLKLRVGLTATPLDDGRPRRLWSQLDLLTPGGFSHSYRRFANRFCDAQPGQYGGIDDRGASNTHELKARCSFFMHEVSYSESHSALPSTRVQVMYLDRSNLNGASHYEEGQTYGQAFKEIAKEARYNGLAKERMIEARLAEACSRKRQYVIDEVKQGVRGGGKVVVFTARRGETELWGQKIRKSLGEGDEKIGEIDIWVAHGGVSETERDKITDAFRVHPGPCVLVATGQSVGTGVDGMQTTDLAIFAMLPWKPGDFVQWKGRFDRLGGRATLLKVPVAMGTYDERVVEILTDKFGPIMDFLAADEIKGLDTKLLGLEDEDALVDSICSRLFGSA